jgi:hypothetical protein
MLVMTVLMVDCLPHCCAGGCRFTALGLGMVLSLLSAIPIFKVCRLYKCAHPNATAAAVV